MSSIRLLILGVLSRKQPIHGYEIRRELELWKADRWANIAYGSIYSALNKMAEEGLIEPAHIEHNDKQTARTVYTITERGKAEFERLLRQYWWELKPTIDPFQIALSFMDDLPASELQDALRHRADQLHTFILTLNHAKTEETRTTQNSRLISESTRLMIAHGETELRWIEEALDKIGRGELP